MRPVPIPDELVPPNCSRRVVAPPDGDLLSESCSPVEVVVGLVEHEGADVVAQVMLITLEPGDLERLAEVGGFYLTMYTTQLPMFSLEVADGQGT